MGRNSKQSYLNVVVCTNWPIAPPPFLILTLLLLALPNSENGVVPADDSFSDSSSNCGEKSTLVWSPLEGLSQEDEDTVDGFLELSCSPAVPHGGRNKEIALHILHQVKGSVKVHRYYYYHYYYIVWQNHAYLITPILACVFGFVFRSALLNIWQCIELNYIEYDKDLLM